MEAAMASQKNNVEKFEKMLESAFSQKRNIKKYLDKTSDDYRYLDPGRFLYETAMKLRVKDSLSDNYIELVYITLKAWNMNSRGAMLRDFSTFRNSIINCKSYFDDLQSKDVDEPLESHRQTLKELFKKLKLTQNTSPLVTFSKTLHFFIPDLIAPIDRKYTLSFFKKNHRGTFQGDNQFSVFMDIQSAYSIFARKHNLKDLLKDSLYKNWNQNIPKIMDNLVIGYMLCQNQNKET